MNVFTIAGIIGLFIIVVGTTFATLFVRLSRVIDDNEQDLVEERNTINPGLTMGFEIPVNAPPAEQVKAARKLAAKRAARLPRGANMRIGRRGASSLRTASEALEDDPMTATKIAIYHTWQGAKMGIPAAGVPQQAPAKAAAAPAAAPTKKPEDLVPGVDYPFIEITDDMSPADVRKARIANAKARSAAVKALKERGPAAAPAPTAAATAPAAAPAASPVVDIPEPEYIEITDDMPPADVRKARIQNAKLRSQYHKALKEAGVDPRQAGQAAAPTAAEPDAPAPAPAVPDDVPQPDYIEITEEMSPEEVRKARVHNAKARSQYFKALKERGIDPKSLEEQTSTTTPAAQAEPAPPASEPAAAVEIPADIPAPDYIEITDDMSPDELRRARVQNARERSRYFKALKEAGIDPKTVAS